ncbi:hypothetical protein ACQPW1_01850 [Nocardia sp. CA-128927]|uniref:hypothetical protein n=1 Tax=Nocardia sp. CA-128927 TaxID=3239975 RepID=UPI003D99D57F
MDADIVQCIEEPNVAPSHPGRCHYARESGAVNVAVDVGETPYVVVAVNWVDPGQRDLDIAKAPTSSWGLTTPHR